MLGEGLGGIEFAFTRYALALKSVGFTVKCCIAKDAAIAAHLDKDTPLAVLPNLSQFDPVAIWRVSRLILRWRPDLILVHGKRAHRIFSLAQWLFGKKAPVVKVLHRPRFNHLATADHVITVTRQLAEQVAAHGVLAKNVTHIPNFLTATPPLLPSRPWQAVPVIGLLCRLVPEKGVDLFLEAAAILQRRGQVFTVKIGGDGALANSLRDRAQALGIGDLIDWAGWVDDSHAFFDSIDIFCLPSRAESFGLVVIEAMAHSKLVVSTKTSGPLELITDRINGLLCDIAPESLADALAYALENPGRSATMAQQGHAESTRYQLSAVVPEIARLLGDVHQNFLARAHKTS
jgi:glycosyltransferase involved in cell wall biosynthesis